MKLLTGLVFCSLVLAVSGGVLSFMKEAALGSWDMWRAIRDLNEANFIGSQRYFYARGKYDAARRGPGGAWAAEMISDARNNILRFFGPGLEDSAEDPEDNRANRGGEDPIIYRPKGLPDKY
ncbi:serum amyloid A-1 protein-like [Urocitellus parryii]